jgi:hypothetical protein
MGEVGPAGMLRNRYDYVTYPAAHAQISRIMGKAKECVCVCGEPAREWAYLGSAPDEMYGPKRPDDPDGIGWGFYSTDPSYYEAMCISCHTKKDGALAARQLREYRTILHESGMVYQEIRELCARG